MRFFAKSLLALALLAAAPAFAEEQPSARVGRVSYISGTLAFYGPGDAGWSAAKANFPVAAGGWFATDPQSRAELGIGVETIDMAGDTQLGITDLRNGVMQIGLTQGRLGLNLRRLGGDETAEVDIPQGGVRLLQPGIYDIDSGTADRPARITVFEGSARFVSGGADMTIKAGDAVVLNGTDVATAKAERAVADDFVKWCRSRDYQEHKLAAPYYVSPAMTGFEELDAYGGWATVPQYGAIWYPNSVPGDWAPTATANGSGSSLGDGPGSTPSPGGSRRSTTGAGPISTTAGAGFPEISCRAPSMHPRWSPLSKMSVSPRRPMRARRWAGSR